MPEPAEPARALSFWLAFLFCRWQQARQVLECPWIAVPEIISRLFRQPDFSEVLAERRQQLVGVCLRRNRPPAILEDVDIRRQGTRYRCHADRAGADRTSGRSICRARGAPARCSPSPPWGRQEHGSARSGSTNARWEPAGYWPHSDEHEMEAPGRRPARAPTSNRIPTATPSPRKSARAIARDEWQLGDEPRCLEMLAFRLRTD
jgi:hypothetical protein